MCKFTSRYGHLLLGDTWRVNGGVNMGVGTGMSIGMVRICGTIPVSY